MADPRPDPYSEDDAGARLDDDTGGRLDRGSTTGTPRWVLVLGVVIAVALVALFVVLHLTGTLGPGLQQ